MAWLDLTPKDRVTHPSLWHVLASAACAVLLLAWAYWVARVGFGVWQGQAFFYKGQELAAADAPLRAWLMLLGTGFLVPYSLLGALQYAWQAWARWGRWCRLQRVLGLQRADSAASEVTLPISKSISSPVAKPLAEPVAAPDSRPATASASTPGPPAEPSLLPALALGAALAASLSPRRRWALRVFGVLLLCLGLYLLVLQWAVLTDGGGAAVGMAAVAVALAVGGGLMVVRPEVFAQ